MSRNVSEMKNVAMIIGASEDEAIEALIRRAKDRVVPFETIRDFATGKIPLPADYNRSFTISIPLFYEATYTEEELKQGLVFRHLSVSCQNRRRVPNQHAMGLLMESFGFVNGLENVIVWEETLRGGGVAINVVEPLDGNVDQLRG